ncbi:TonB-dependent receptor [Povalibacter sp.]|uniref:TonB-dependent receptor n=1 Tax=Povalibacter sp. TaxID=1962978 RepID=UPI002F3F2155
MSIPTKRSRVPASLRSTRGTLAPAIRATLSTGITGLMLVPALAFSAETPATSENARQLPMIKVEDTAIDPNPNAELGVPYKARTSGDERHTRPLAETPQTISVLTKAAIDDSGYTDLRQILDAQPGITVGTGENGNAFGDRYIIRGQEARSDVFVDGLRDPGMTTRESFAIEQLEISKGPNSSFSGRGTSGGSVNAITKQAATGLNFGKLSTGFGTDDYMRLTLDVNQAFGDHLAVRGNALYSYEEVPDRGPTDRRRKGLALSGLYTSTDKLDVVVDYYGLRAADNPDLGGYLTGTVPNRVPAKNVPVYAQQPDFQDSDVDTGTARITYRFAPALRLTNLTRLGNADNGYVVTGARGATTAANNPGGVYDTVTLSTHHGWQQVDYFANQSNLFWDTELFGKSHALVFGLEYTDHSVLNGVYSIANSGQNCISGNSTTLNAWCVVAPNGAPINGINTVMNRQITRGTWDTDWNVKTTSASILDTFDLNDTWSLFLGVRADHFDFDMTTQNANTLAQANYEYSDTLINGHLGVTYKLDNGGMFYASIATASDINGGESDVGTSSGYGGVVVHDGNVAGADPESSVNLELGTKWNIFDEKLLLTAAVFQSTKSDVMEGANYDSVGTFNTGKSRIRGVEFGVSGELLENLTAQAGVTFMDSEVLESATPANVGKTLSNFADNSASAQLRYEITEDFALGVAVKYVSEQFGGQPDTAAAFNAEGQYSQPIPDYTVGDVFASFRVTEALDVRLNINNVTDEDYYLAVYRSGSFLYKGDARTVRLTFNYAL